jgi:plasmid stability protein
MFTIQLRNLPESTYLAIKESAKASKRSMTQEAIVLLDNALKIGNSVQNSKLKALSELKNMALENKSVSNMNEILDLIEEDRNR